MESRTQCSRPRTQKNFETKAKDRSSRGQGPRTQTQVFSEKKKVLKIFSGDLKKRSLKFFSGKKGVQKFFFRRSLLEETKKRSLQIFRKVSSVFQRNFTDSKIVLSLSRGQGNFRGLEASRPRTSKCVLENVLEDSTSAIRTFFRIFNTAKRRKTFLPYFDLKKYEFKIIRKKTFFCFSSFCIGFAHNQVPCNAPYVAVADTFYRPDNLCMINWPRIWQKMLQTKLFYSTPSIFMEDFQLLVFV